MFLVSSCSCLCPIHWSQTSDQSLPGAHFTNDFSIVIHIWRKFHSALIQVIVKWSLRNLAHGTTAVLSWHVKNFVAIWHLTIELHWNQFFIEFELWWKWALNQWLLSSLVYIIRLTERIYFNSLWPSDAIWRHKSGSTLAQAMACCLTASYHYLNQCWLISSEVKYHSTESISDITATKHWD